MDVTEPVVRTAAGLVRGRAKDGVAVFRGIPFAQPPVGDLRFAAPRPARGWDGVRDAAVFGPPPPQSAYAVTPAPPGAPGTDPKDIQFFEAAIGDILGDRAGEDARGSESDAQSARQEGGRR